MAKEVFKINTKEELLKHASKMVLKSNLEQLIDTSVIENTYQYADKLQKIKDITPENGAWDFINSADEHLAEYTSALGEHIAYLVAANICDNNHGIDGVKFEVPNELKTEIKQAAAEYQKKCEEKRQALDEHFAVLNYITYGENEAEFEKAKDSLGDITEQFSEENLRRVRFKRADMTLNMYACKNLTMDNYARRLSNADNKTELAWATEAVENMIKGLYSNEEYQKLSADKENIINSIYIDGKPASFMCQNGTSYEAKCAQIISNVLSGEHKINVVGMKEVNGNFVHTDEVAPVNVKPQVVCEEKFSLWKAILRFFGIGKTDKQKAEEKISFAQLGNEDAISKIKEYNLIDREFAEKVSLVRDAEENHARQIVALDDLVFGEQLGNPENYFSEASEYYNKFNGTEHATKEVYVGILNRQHTRTSMFMAYAMGKGMSLDAILNPTQADKQQLKEYGREFINIVTLPKREDIAKQVYPDYTPEQLNKVIKTDDKQFREAYDNAVKAKSSDIIEMYGALTNTLIRFQQNIQAVDYTDMQAVAEALPAHQFFSQACCDIMQSIAKSPLRNNIVGNTAYNFASESMFKTQLATYTPALAAPNIALKIPTDSTMTSIALALSSMYVNTRLDNNAENATDKEKNLKLYKTAFYNELSNMQQEKDGANLLKYAKEILLGKRPMPKNLISPSKENEFPYYETHLIDCYNKDKNKAVKTLDKPNEL